ncbi:facilitated trehalose transporter Tret1-like [Teleopsis dalmanni]|uniref:facilitated trehalose transporter Tret1-like n=1 Tax=Teleopsis dalmanni TaxID=139649 RepID=UPI0018CDC5EF|nr:facilitated trehalose transporter Tret1-like [Teleopsis dalmanni]
MFLNIFNFSEGVFSREYRKQLLTALSVTIITLSHGIALGWVSPMLHKLQKIGETPFDFAINVEQASWIGAFTCVGGFIGNITLGSLLDTIGRKAAIYFLAIPHLCFWGLVYFASTIEHLYVARILSGISGGGCYIVIPIFLSEIADANVRGRLTSLFILTINTGILVGYILSSHLPYKVIPCVAVVLPILYLTTATWYPETPLHLLRRGRYAEAENALKFYRNFEPNSKVEIQQFNTAFAEMKDGIMQQKATSGDVSIKDFFTKNALKAFATGLILMLVNIFSGVFAFVNYMSTIFDKSKADLDPDTNTIIIGVVQIVGTYTATVLVDRYGRKILMIVSTGSMSLGLAAFGMYAFFVEEIEVDLSSYSWLPLLLMAFVIFMANVGVNAVSFIILVEVMPAKIRSKAASICMTLLSGFAFVMLKVFPILMNVFGLSATMWFCGSVCTIGLFYVCVFLKETKGKSMSKDDADS